jgi:hypothetical protein
MALGRMSFRPTPAQKRRTKTGYQKVFRLHASFDKERKAVQCTCRRGKKNYLTPLGAHSPRYTPLMGEIKICLGRSKYNARSWVP